MNANHASIATIDEIDLQFAQRAFYWNSFHAEDRGKQAREDYANTVNTLYSDMVALCTNEAQREVLEAEIARFRDNYKAKFCAWLGAVGNTASPMVTGPANFPTERNRKKLEAERNRFGELIQLEENARESITKKILDARTYSEKLDAEKERVRRRVTSSLATISEIDTGVNQYTMRSLIVSNMVGRIERMMANGEADLVKYALELIEEYNSTHKKPAVTKSHKMWTFSEMAEKVQALRKAREDASKNADDTLFFEMDGAKVILNHQIDRVQILFPSIPSAEMRDKLKGSGWRWSPREGAWQRQLTESAKWSAKAILGYNH